MLEQCMREVHTVARARRVQLPDAVVANTLAVLDSMPAAATTPLQRDIADGRPSELEAWNGAVVRLAREAGVVTPLHEFIYHSLLPSERRTRGEIRFPE
jgi:2-dehydropantoate 2-reductase